MTDLFFNVVFSIVLYKLAEREVLPGSCIYKVQWLCANIYQG